MAITESRVAPGRSPTAESAAPRRPEVGVAQNRGPEWLADALDVARQNKATPGTKAVMDVIDGAITELRLTPLKDLPKEAVRAFFERMPKIDLHRHLNGSIPIERLFETAQRLGIPLPASDVEGLRPHVQMGADEKRTFPGYLGKFDLIGTVLKSPTVIETLAAACIEDAARDNLAHVEIRFAPQYMAAAHGLDLDDVVKAVCAGVKKGVDASGTTARLIIIIARQKGVDEGAVVAKLAEKYRDFGVVALDLASASETDFPPGPYADVFRGARKKALCATVHAGESAGAESIEDAVRLLRAQRIGHATRILENSEVVDLLRTNGTFVEACVTANWQVGAIEAIAHHPVITLLRLGVLVALCTDNPAVSGVTLSREFERLVDTFKDVTLGDVEKLVQNSVDGAFLSVRERAQLGRRVVKELGDAEEALVRDTWGRDGKVG